ncbi:polyhydroxyalkanoate depolymerase [Agrobacterium rosae]|uniref:Polyhydroxyalkanoate depolymerase n=1 Tax=Agrobacterium rosae TaxID=1972867 RepID=A0AAE5RUI6_9HYPH|nr:polyhydroxyalkanoate depolymerase [Agrobacterium rosae]KAA3510596.1 polyhydroxyalkanoate depolymerase [Agrobacterium rosae]KAA3517314.1 polyhydroxyalkanoate depolymerase [Agrobacterium rosae]MCM2434781.1 polyhydroxyalkanoate depolymerase [Agrobacterium rosae]MDX8330323.1 polyhydroxyalkanoate depolymerase [Agrobacterium rosae]MQB50062.1 polyhydroxyalkanoate depolymerase [Agrobacterium rosae]
MFYHLYEMNHAAMAPLRAGADMMRQAYSNPLSPLSNTAFGRSMDAGFEVFERLTRRYGKPEFGLSSTVVDGKPVSVIEETVWSRPFCNLVRFNRDLGANRKADPKILIVSPMSGHYSTLLRGTVEALLPYGEIYITDWIDARTVPVTDGGFDLDDYISHVIDMLHHIGEGVHVVAVCQPSVPVLAAVSLMEADDDTCAPASMTLMGGPIDTRINPTAVNEMAKGKPIEWFRDNVVMQVPWPQPGFGRPVYPGFLQLSGFMSMNLDRHMTAHKDFYLNLVKNDGDSAEKHREFYDEYLAVMDLTAEFYLQTVETVFIEHALPKGMMLHKGRAVDPSAIRHTALFTVEGENDDISGVGQTKAAHDICLNLPDSKREHYMQPDVGHYGVFNGSRFRSDIVPRMVDFMRKHEKAA